ncbi:MAG TPA: COR domain-containing protein [Myxococcaceae bacterium]|nr:COR domain-containing protein [Myxococcaceae bacterium]
MRKRIRDAKRDPGKSLDLTDLGLVEWPKELFELDQLEVLTMWGNRLQSIPQELAKLRRLHTLQLSRNALEEVPSWLFELPDLKRLSLSRNRLTRLPLEGLRSSSLEMLFLNGNRIEALPAIAALTRLKRLTIVENPLKTLPTEWPELEVLDAHGVGISEVPSFGSLRSLRSLALSFNPITKLPIEIARHEGLKELYLAETALRAFPDALGDLRQLTILELSCTPVLTLPSWLGELTQLKYLGVSRCGLGALPPEMERLRELETMAAANVGAEYRLSSTSRMSSTSADGVPNDLTRLPGGLRKLAKLKRLYLHGNTSLGIPDEILGPTQWKLRQEPDATASSILAYYFRLTEGVAPLNEAKLILLGRGGVGKTSLVNRLVHKRFHRKEAKTDGIEITPWSIRVKPNEKIRLNVWDFGGQEIMHATHQFFLTHRSVYLLVLSGRGGGEDADADYWLRLIESYGSDSSGEESPVVVVLNKIKEHPFQLDQRGLRAKYPNIREFVETDCEAPLGISALARIIKGETRRLKHLRDPFPASWFAIKNRLAGMAENYLTYEQFRDVCKSSGEPDDTGQDQLAMYLHNLGIALNYRDDPRLRDTHVLNPHWVTDGIYTILNSPLLATQRGEFELAQLQAILDKRKFPPRMHQFLINLMRRFELCFPFPDDDARYLIPELLGKEQPDLGAFHLAEGINFQYDYSVLPEGLLPRFIVRTHVLSTGLPRWRTGVILEMEGRRAAVVADVQDRKVRIEVSGAVGGRRRLLAVIRANFEAIHAGFEKLKPVEMVPVPGYPRSLVRFDKLTALEAAGRRTFDEVVDGKVLELNVREMLDGVDIRTTPALERVRATPVQVFISYSHKDEVFRNELETHLTLLQRQGLISMWTDRRIAPGDDWETSIDERIATADIVLLLVSADFLASDYCYRQEMSRALRRHEAGEARVIPIIIRDVAWKIAPFAELQALPPDEAVASAQNRDTAWRQVAEGIEAVVKETLGMPKFRA